MSTFEIQPQFSEPSPKLKVDPSMLQNGLWLLLNSVVLGRSIVVDVTVHDTVSNRNEWRVNIPPREYEIYRAISNILNYKDAVYSAHVRRGTMVPREFVVNVWCRTKNDPSIIGSCD